MGTPLTDTQFAEQLATYARTAFRLEQQPAYNEPSEHGMVQRYVAGEPVDPAAESPGLAAWFTQVAEQTAAGKTMRRVRVHDDPPTDYQRFVRWLDRWNTQAGERIDYLTRAQATEIGLFPDVGADDWWLLDDNRLIVMRFDDQHRRILNLLETNPKIVAQARAWRDLAVRGVEKYATANH